MKLEVIKAIIILLSSQEFQTGYWMSFLINIHTNIQF